MLTLKDEVFRAPLYIGKAYSIDNVVEKEAGVNYTIKQLFYLDGEFKKHDIPNDGTVFTQNEPYDVTLEIEGETAVRTAKWWKSRSISTRTPFWTHL